MSKRMRNRLTELQAFDRANSAMAQHILKYPEQYGPRLRRWARSVTLAQAEHYEKSTRYARVCLRLLERMEGQ
jgi:hypothetical protein